MTNQPEALLLADELTFHGRFAHESEDVAARRRYKRNSQAAAELRRLHEVNAELLEALKELLRVESTHDDGEIVLEVARHNAKAAIAKAERQP